MKHIALLSALLLTIAAPALAQARRPWISGTTGFGWYMAADVNDQVRELRNDPGLAMDYLRSGAQLGVAAGLDLPNGWTLGGGYERLLASTDGTVRTLQVDYQLPADVIRVFGRYTFQRAGRTRSFAEGSLGFLSTDGALKTASAYESARTIDIEGTGLSLEGSVGFERWLTPALALSACVGGRKAEALDIAWDGEGISNENGDEFVVDYSGFFLRAALKLAAPRR